MGASSILRLEGEAAGAGRPQSDERKRAAVICPGDSALGQALAGCGYSRAGKPREVPDRQANRVQDGEHWSERQSVSVREHREDTATRRHL